MQDQCKQDVGMVRGMLLFCESIRRKVYQSTQFKFSWPIVMGGVALLVLSACSSVEKISDDISERFGKSDSKSEQALVSTSTPAEPELSEKEVLLSAIQTGLDKLGYGPGRTDGSMDSQTEAAIQDFQLDNDLRINGRASESLLESIESKLAGN